MSDRALWELCQGEGSLERARELLADGANPNVVFANDFGPVSALFGAVGERRDAELTRLLLERGADPNGEPTFGDALYHSVESPDPELTRMLLEAGARPQGSHALAHALDYERREHVDLLLAHGAQPDGGDLVHAIRRGRALATVELLVERGADVNGRGGEWYTPEEQWRTAYEHALLRNRSDVMELLAAADARTDCTEGDRAVAAVARGERVELPEPLDPDPQEVLAESVLHRRNELVIELLGIDRVLYNGGGPAGTVLRMAAWMGDPELVEWLLARGADPTLTTGDTGTPSDWSAHGADNPRVNELLVAQRLE